jgi:aminoglycoside phosphotransferase (APT) family kinase protein
VQDAKPLPGGEVHSVYELWDGTGDSYVLKVYRPELAGKREKEILLCALVRERTGVPAPDVVPVEPRAAAMSRLPGVALRLLALEGSELEAVWRQAGRLLRELHTIEFERFGYIETGVTVPADTNLEYMRRRIAGKIAQGPPALRESLARHFAQREQAFAGCEQAVLCHNDAHDANLLVEDGRITGLVDWENAVAADPILDLAKAHAFSDGASEATLAALVEGYGPLRPDWRQAFDLYVLDHLLELWVWLAHVGRTEPLELIERGLRDRIGDRD